MIELSLSFNILVFALQSVERGDAAGKELRWCWRTVTAARLAIRITDGSLCPSADLLPGNLPKSTPLLGEIANSASTDTATYAT